FSESHQRALVPPFSCADGRLRTAVNMMLSKAADARPSQQRLQTLLGTITGQPIQIVSKPFSDLADAGAQIAEVQQRARAKLEAGMFKESGWDVLGHSIIAVGQDRPDYVWGASLWYVKLRGGVDYRWYETSYWAWSTERHQPFALGQAEMLTTLHPISPIR